MTQSREWWRDDSHPDAKLHRTFLEKAAKEEAERVLAIVPVRKALPPPRPRKKAARDDSALFEHLGQLTAKAIKDATAPLEARIAQLEAHPLKYCDVWKSGGDYRAGNFVSWGGSVWHCNEDGTTEKPGTGPTWTLAVKRGRDGKDAKP
jgi:hypothetical protein